MMIDRHGDKNASEAMRARATIISTHASEYAPHAWVKTEADAFGHQFVYWTCDVCNGFWPATYSPSPDDYPLPCIPKQEQMRMVNEQDHPHRHIVMLHQTCSACPSQWEGLTSTGEVVYIRYRSGYGRIGFGRTLGDAIEDESTFLWYGDDPFDGVISLEEVVDLAPAYITFEDGIGYDYDAKLASVIEDIDQMVQSVPADEAGDGVQQTTRPHGWSSI